MRPHQSFSFEELRSADYKAGCKPTISSVGMDMRVVYCDQSTQAGIPSPPASSVYASATSSLATTPGVAADAYKTKARDSTNMNSTFLFSEIKSQQTEPIVQPSVLSCPFCQITFNAVWEVAEHLESTFCEQSPDLNRSSMHRRQCQQDPDGVVTVQITNRGVNGHITESLLYRCPNKARSCKGKFMTSFAELLAHLESEVCGFIKREELWKDISECKGLWKDSSDC
jgi:hypothetical protein